MNESKLEFQDSRRANVLLLISMILNIVVVAMMRLLGNIMYPFFTLYYIWLVAYSFLLFTLMYRERESEKPLIDNKMKLYLVVIITVGVRLPFLGTSDSLSIDNLWYLDFGNFLLRGNIPYSDFYFPYPPVFAYFIFLIYSVAPFIDSFRLLAIILDAGIVLVIWKIMQLHGNSKYASTTVIAYALLPISIIESGWNAHFEPLANLFMLIALWFLFKKNHRASGVAIGLGAATKIYPGLLFPIFLFFLKRWKQRIEFTVLAFVSALITLVPFILMGHSTTSPSFNGGSNNYNLFMSLLDFLISPSYPSIILSVAFLAIIVSIILMVSSQFFKSQAELNLDLYNKLILILGCILIIIGIVSCGYILSPYSKSSYWRFPIDVGILRGISAVILGVLIIALTKRRLRDKSGRNIDSTQVLILSSAIILFVIAFSRDAFYGWYLLWCIPLFLLLQDRRLGFTMVFCLLLLYPMYAYDNFMSLGFKEPRIWSDEFETINEWILSYQIPATGPNESEIISSVYSDTQNGIFRVDTSDVAEESLLHNVNITFEKQVQIQFNSATEFVAKISCNWNPVFDSFADISLNFVGHTNDEQRINGSIIHRTGLLTNHSFILWRYSFYNEYPFVGNGIIDTLYLTIYPQEPSIAIYHIDYFYTTTLDAWYPIYFISFTSFSALTILAYTLLFRELKRYD